MNPLRKALKKKIRKISQLKPDWNGLSASGGREYPIESARKLLEAIPNENLGGLDIFPTQRETVQFEVDELGIYVQR